MVELARPALQMALDGTELDTALRLAAHAYPWWDVLEVGTPLVLEAGMEAVRRLSAAYPDRPILADCKIADAGYLEASSAFRAGAQMVTVLALADEATISGCVDAAKEWNGWIVADLMHCADPVDRACRLLALGVQMVCVHTAHDRGPAGATAFAAIPAIIRRSGGFVAVAGGLDETGIAAATRAGASVLVVGSRIAQAEDPGQMARTLRFAMGRGA